MDTELRQREMHAVGRIVEMAAPVEAKAIGDLDQFAHAAARPKVTGTWLRGFCSSLISMAVPQEWFARFGGTGLVAPHLSRALKAPAQVMTRSIRLARRQAANSC